MTPDLNAFAEKHINGDEPIGGHHLDRPLVAAVRDWKGLLAFAFLIGLAVLA